RRARVLRRAVRDVGVVLARGLGRQLALGYRVARAAVDPVRVDADRLGPSRAGVHLRADPAGDRPHAAVWDRPAEGVAMSAVISSRARRAPLPSSPRKRGPSPDAAVSRRRTAALCYCWIPAFAGMTGSAFAGMTRSAFAGMTRSGRR